MNTFRTKRRKKTFPGFFFCQLGWELGLLEYWTPIFEMKVKGVLINVNMSGFLVSCTIRFHTYFGYSKEPPHLYSSFESPQNTSRGPVGDGVGVTFDFIATYGRCAS